MRDVRLLIAAAIVGALATSSVAVRTQVKAPDKAEVALRAAMEKETVAGDLKGAIEEYRTIATTYAKSNRAVAARALLRLAGCYEKLGGEQARTTYQRLLSEYADQTQVADEARTRLAALAAPAMNPTFTKIRVPTKLPMISEVALSPDGQQLAYATSAGVWLMPVHGPADFEIAGAARRIAQTERRWSSVTSVRWSRDGKWIALYAWERLPEGGEDGIIYVVPSAGGELTRVPLQLKNYTHTFWDQEISLSPDGAWLAYTTWKDGETADQRRVYLTPTKGGSTRALTAPPSREPVFSPDGKHIAYVGLQSVEGEGVPANKPQGRQLWVIPTEGGAARLVYEMSAPGSLLDPMWSPDGTVLAFLVRRQASFNAELEATPLVFVHVTPEGRAASPPIEIELPQLTWAVLPGWGSDNRIGLVFNSTRVIALYTVSASGGKALQVTASDAFMPSWAHDSSRIYFGGFGIAKPGVYLASVPASGGNVTRVPIKHDRPFTISWISVSPDGSRILLCARNYRSTQGDADVSHFFTVPIGGGELTEVPTGMPWVYLPVWSPDGASMAFIGGEDVPNTNTTLYNIYTMPLKGGAPERLTSTTDKVLFSSGLAWSPDGRSIAYYSDDFKLKQVPAGGGPSKVLVEGLKGNLEDAGLAWSPDGRELAYFSQGKIFRLNLAMGTSIEVPTGLDGYLMQPAWSPDGKTVAFNAVQGGEPELWLMDDFLPLLKAPPRKQK